jgi:hypothetical protein
MKPEGEALLSFLVRSAAVGKILTARWFLVAPPMEDVACPGWLRQCQRNP